MDPDRSLTCTNSEGATSSGLLDTEEVTSSILVSPTTHDRPLTSRFRGLCRVRGILSPTAQPENTST